MELQAQDRGSYGTYYTWNLLAKPGFELGTNDSPPAGTAAWSINTRSHRPRVYHRSAPARRSSHVTGGFLMPSRRYTTTATW